MARFHVAQEEVDNVLSYACRLLVGVDEGACLFRYVAVYDAHNLLGVNLNVVGAYALSHREQRDGLAVWIFVTLVDVVQEL